ncbi:MAG: ABC transporter ATP-binding protein [Peptostreptococcaceae bacterium]
MSENTILKVKNLKIELLNNDKNLLAINDINFDLLKGKTIGIIGESGSGKSLLCSTILGLLNKDKWKISGDIYFKDTFLQYQNNKFMCKYRGKHIALITQNPMSSFDPLMTIKGHFIETLKEHSYLSENQIKEKAISILEKLRIHNPKNVLNSYSFQLSGGTLQRIMIAIAICLEPEILIADEPTTALDLTVQYEIIKILQSMKKEFNTSIILVSHDLGVISDLADEILVMYGGNIIEKASTRELLTNAQHPYTKGLLSSRPSFSKNRLTTLEGTPPNLFERGNGCEFYNRCSLKNEKCENHIPSNIKIDFNHEVRCLQFEEDNYNYGTA